MRMIESHGNPIHSLYGLQRESPNWIQEGIADILAALGSVRRETGLGDWTSQKGVRTIRCA